MEGIEQLAMAPLGLVDQFQQELKMILDDRTLPTPDKIMRINSLKEKMHQECENQCDAFDREAQEVERELLQRLEQLRESRELNSVIRRAIEPMFRPS